MDLLYTSGYEQATPEDFVRRLRERRVTRVIDVRDLPLSRKAGFSKSALQAYLAEQGLAYEHWKELGAPKPLRDAVKAGGEWTDYERGYSEILARNEEALEALLEKVRGEVLCLICFERDPARCHRRLVAEALARPRPRAVRVEHVRY